MDDRLPTLKKISLFASLSDEMLAELTTRAPERRFARGELIFEDGDIGNCLYAIQAGEVEIVKSAGEHELSLALL